MHLDKINYILKGFSKYLSTTDYKENKCKYFDDLSICKEIYVHTYLDKSFEEM